MQILIRTVLLVTLLWNVKADYPESTNSMYIPSSQCTFYYNQSTEFSFNYCSTTAMLIFTWKTCLESCCTQLPYGYTLPTKQVLNICKGSQSDSSAVIIIVSVILAGTLAITIFCSLCRHCLLIRQANRIAQEHSQPDDVQWPQEALITNIITEIKWSFNAKQDLPLKNIDCSICLDDNPTAELFCRHQYHPKCIGGWLNKSSCCPCCRMSIRGVKVYCCNCKWRYIVCKRTFLLIFGQQLSLRCPYCSQGREREGEPVSFESLFQCQQSKHELQDFPHESNEHLDV